MTVQLEKSYYLNAFKNADIEFKTKKEITNYAKTHLQFSYGSIAYKDFAEKYDSKDWLARKVLALPLAAWTGVVTTTYHLALTILFGIPASIVDQGTTFKMHLFSAGRNFQEAFGRLMSIFNDKFGLYHIQESQFHQACYRIYDAEQNRIKEAHHNITIPPLVNPPIAPVPPAVNPLPAPPAPALNGMPQIPPLPAFPQVLPQPANPTNPVFQAIDLNPLIPPMQKPADPSALPVVMPAEAFPELKEMEESLMKCYKLLVQLLRQMQAEGLKPEINIDVNELGKTLSVQNILEHPVNNPHLSIGVVNKWKERLDNLFAVKYALLFCRMKQINGNEQGKEERNALIEMGYTLSPIANCVAQGYYLLGKPKEAFAVIEKAYSSPFKEQFLNKMAQDYYQKGDLDSTFVVVKEMSRSDNKSKEAYLMLLAYDFFQKGELKKALDVNSDLEYKVREKFISQVAYEYLKKGNLEVAFKVIKELSHDYKLRELFIAKYAQELLKLGKPEESLKIIKELSHDYKRREAFIVHIAEAYFNQGKLEESFKTIDELIHDTKAKKSFIVKLAEEYYKQGNFEAALKIFKESNQDYEIREKFYLKVSSNYVQLGDLKNALKVAKEIIHDYKTREILFATIAEAHYRKGEIDKARKVADEIIHDYKTKEALKRKYGPGE